MKKQLLILVMIVLFSGMITLLKPIRQALALYAAVPLKGTVIVIDPGHGGKDPGASQHHVPEDQLNLEISRKLRDILTAAGAQVIMTRDDDYDLAEEGSDHVKQEDLKKRVEMMNQPEVTLFISIHGNISLDHTCKGAEVYYRNHDPFSKQLAESVLERLRTVSDSRYQVKKGDYYILNQTKTLGILVETGFLSNDEDLKRLQNSSYQEKLAYGIYEGICDFLTILH